MYGGSGVRRPARRGAGAASVPPRAARAARRRRNGDPARSRRDGRASPSQTPSPPSRSSSSTSPRRRSLAIRAGTTRVSLTTASASPMLVRQLGEHSMTDARRTRARRRAVATRRGAPLAAARSAPAEGRSRAPTTCIRRPRYRCRAWTKPRSSARRSASSGASRRAPPLDAALDRARLQLEALAAAAERAAGELPDRVERRRPGGLRERGSPRRTESRGDPRSDEPGAAPARRLEGRARRAERAHRRPRAARRPRVLGLAGRRRQARAVSDGSGIQAHGGAVVYRIEDGRPAAASGAGSYVTSKSVAGADRPQRPPADRIGLSAQQNLLRLLAEVRGGGSAAGSGRRRRRRTGSSPSAPSSRVP